MGGAVCLLTSVWAGGDPHREGEGSPCAKSHPVPRQPLKKAQLSPANREAGQEPAVLPHQPSQGWSSLKTDGLVSSTQRTGL